MSIHTKVLVVFLVIGVITLDAFIAAAYIANRSKDRTKTAGGVLALCALIFAVLMGAARAGAAKFGPFVSTEAALVACALAAALLGGYGAGMKRKLGKEMGVLMYLLAALVVSGSTLGKAYQLASTASVAADQVGLGDTTKYEPEKNKTCSENLKSLYFAFSKYVETNGALPKADNWLRDEDIASKIQVESYKHCPAVSNGSDGKFGYAFNPNLSGMSTGGKALKDIPKAATTPLLYDTADVAPNAHGGADTLPKPGRHGGRNNILYCDGHVDAVASN